MMQSLLRELCGLSILCGAALALTPEGKWKKAMGFVSSVVLMACVLNGIRGFDWRAYAAETALYREREQSFLRKSEETRDALDRRVIERECAAYIGDKAASLGYVLNGIELEMVWSVEGVWVPHAVSLTGSGAIEARDRLSAILETELGIPPDRQEWRENGSG